VFVKIPQQYQAITILKFGFLFTGPKKESMFIETNNCFVHTANSAESNNNLFQWRNRNKFSNDFTRAEPFTEKFLEYKGANVYLRPYPATLKSKKAETKTLSIVTPVSKTGSTVNFIAGAADASHSDISGTGPVSADGISASWISITLGDAYGNPVVGVFPIFNATGTNNTIGACSASNSSGVATCSLASSTAEVKTLQLTSPIAVTGSGTVTFTSGGPVAVNSTITGTTLEVVADGSSVLEVKIILRDASNNLVNGWTPTFDATDTNSKNAYFDCSMSGTSQNGESICSMTSTMAEMKTLRITSPVNKLGGNVTFTAGLAAATNSSISGTSPVTANGSDISTITINLKDFYNNPVSGSVPTFSASGTSNTY
jgi:adhesin/invasin